MMKMDNEKLKEIGTYARKNLAAMCPALLPYPQPGMFNGNEVLFIFQNPGVPRQQTKSDFVITKKDATYDELAVAYEDVLKTCMLGKFINDLGVKWEKISITNLVKLPSLGNRAPNEWEIAINIPVLKEQVRVLSPKLIVLVGSLCKQHLSFLEKDYNVMHIAHYSYHIRKGDYKQFVGDTRAEIKRRRQC
jgi:hypothetical protein